MYGVKYVLTYFIVYVNCHGLEFVITNRAVYIRVGTGHGYTNSWGSCVKTSYIN